MRREYPLAPIVGVGAVVIEDGKVLLVRRGQEPLKGEWSLPGGALELGETMEEGVMREVFEETGVQVSPACIVEVFDKITKDPPTGRTRYHYVLIDFLCTPVGGTIGGGSDAEEARWVDWQSSPEAYKLEPFTVAVIEKAFQKKLLIPSESPDQLP